MRRTTVDLLLYGGCLSLLGIYLFMSLSRIAAQYQLMTCFVAIYILLTGVATLLQLRVAAPLYLAAIGFLFLWAVLRMALVGYSQGRLAMVLGAIVAAPGYWVLKSALGRIAAQDT